MATSAPARRATASFSAPPAAGQLGAGDEREGRLHLVLPAHHEDVEEVAARRPHLDGERAGSELRLRHLAYPQVPGLRPPVDDDRAHALLYRRPRGADATRTKGAPTCSRPPSSATSPRGSCSRTSA